MNGVEILDSNLDPSTGASSPYRAVCVAFVPADTAVAAATRAVKAVKVGVGQVSSVATLTPAARRRSAGHEPGTEPVGRGALG
jgi:hypothetical protein